MARARPPRRHRRGAVVLLALLAVTAIAIAAVVFVRSRQEQRSAPALCERLVQAQDLDVAFATLDPATLDPQARALRRAKAVAPQEIRPSVDTLANFVSQLTDAIDGAGNDRRSALSDALAARQDQIEEVGGAGRAVQAWSRENCGLSLGGTPAGGTPASGTPTSGTPTSGGAPVPSTSTAGPGPGSGGG